MTAPTGHAWELLSEEHLRRLTVAISGANHRGFPAVDVRSLSTVLEAVAPVVAAIRDEATGRRQTTHISDDRLTAICGASLVEPDDQDRSDVDCLPCLAGEPRPTVSTRLRNFAIRRLVTGRFRG